jgi:hypothetical protein
MKLTGHEAIESAERLGLPLQKFTDPTEESGMVSIDEARAIAAVDPSLIWIDAVAVAEAGVAQELAAYNAAWEAFKAYVARPDHDIRSTEYAELEGAYLAAMASYDAACARLVEVDVE